MTTVSEESLVLQYRLTGTEGDFGVWGHEYIRHLSGEIGREYNKRIKDERPVDDMCDSGCIIWFLIVLQLETC
jgi:26S proteasome regulatory subunit N1